MRDAGNPFSRLPPSRRLQQAARAAGVTGSTVEIDAWAKRSGWFDARGDVTNHEGEKNGRSG